MFKFAVKITILSLAFALVVACGSGDSEQTKPAAPPKATPAQPAQPATPAQPAQPADPMAKGKGKGQDDSKKSEE